MLLEGGTRIQPLYWRERQRSLLTGEQGLSLLSNRSRSTGTVVFCPARNRRDR